MMKLIVAFALIAVCICPGGYITQAINEESSAKAFEILNTANNGSNSFLRSLIISRPILVMYATQLVAGLNHGMVYKVQGSKGEYACVKIFEALNGEFTMTESDFSESKEDAAKQCKIPDNFAQNIAYQ